MVAVTPSSFSRDFSNAKRIDDESLSYALLSANASIRSPYSSNGSSLSVRKHDAASRQTSASSSLNNLINCAVHQQRDDRLAMLLDATFATPSRCDASPVSASLTSAGSEWKSAAKLERRAPASRTWGCWDRSILSTIGRSSEKWSRTP